jgi:hypothetical protein
MRLSGIPLSCNASRIRYFGENINRGQSIGDCTILSWDCRREVHPYVVEVERAASFSGVFVGCFPDVLAKIAFTARNIECMGGRFNAAIL